MNIHVNLNRSPYGRSVLSGILAAVREEPDCMLWMGNPNVPQDIPETIDGFIGAARPISSLPHAADLPVININSEPVEGTWQVCPDNQAVCKMAFDHLYERQIRQFCYFHLAFGSASPSRVSAFQECAEKAGCPCTVIRVDDRRILERDGDLLVEPLRDLPLPLGVLIPRDMCAPSVVKACQKLGFRIPEDVAIVSVNNVIPICTSTDPELTSIEQDAEAIGVRTLELMLKLVRGEKIPKTPVVVPPRQLVARGSTNRRLRRDDNVVRAIDYMLTTLSEPIVLEDLLRQQSLSQSVFERRFKQETGMPPMRYLRHLRLDRAKQLLETTDLKVIEIAGRCGIPDPNHLCALFRQHLKTSPLAYRRKRVEKEG